MSTYPYVITLERPSYKGVDWTTQIMIFFSIIVFAYTAYLDVEGRKWYLIFLSILSLALFRNLWLAKSKDVVMYRITLFLAGSFWFMHPYGKWLGWIFLIAGFLEWQIKFPEEIAVSENHVIFNSFPRKKYKWNEIENILIKDGILTIDFKNNKLFQKKLQSTVSTSIEQEFNNFCTTQLQSSNNTVSNP